MNQNQIGLAGSSRRTLFAVALTMLAAPYAWAEAPRVTRAQVDTPKRVLFVGNSYYYYNNSLHNHVRRMAVAADPSLEKALQYKSATIGGSVLAHHNIDWLTKPGQIGVKEPFELVVLAGNSADALSPKTRDAFRASVVEFNRTITERGGRTALYMTHSYVPPHKNVDPQNARKTEDMYVSVGNEVGALVIPVGLAFEEAYRRHPELKLHDANDGSHPSLHGSYLAASTVYATLYGKSPVGNAYDYHGAVDAATAAKLQQVAQDTVRKFFGQP